MGTVPVPGRGQAGTGDEEPGAAGGDAEDLQVIPADTLEATRADDLFRRLHADAGHAQNHLVVGAVDVHRKNLGIAQRVTDLGVDLQIQIGRIGGENEL